MAERTLIGTREIVGTLAGMEAKNGGWMRFSIHEPGKQHPVKAETKKAELISQCQSLLGNVVKIKVNEYDSGNPNPNRAGTNYIDRYLEEVALAQAGEVSSEAPQQQGQQQAVVANASAQGGVSGAQQGGSYTVPDHEKTRQIRIMRQNALSHAVARQVAEKIGPTTKDLIEDAELHMAYIVHGPSRFGVTAFGAAAAQAAPQPQQEAAPEPTPEPVSDPLRPVVTDDGSYVCPDCGTNDPHNHGPDCIPF